MKLNGLVIIGVAVTTAVSCAPSKKEYTSYELYPVRTGNLTEMKYNPDAMQFTLWSSTADEVRLILYGAGDGGYAYETVAISPVENGTWTARVEQDLKGKFYTFNVKIDGKWLDDTPGINAHVVGVNGKRAAIIDMRETDPEGWEEDQRSPLALPADVIIYEVHHRDFSVDPPSGIKNKGKFLTMTETGTVSPDKLATGIDHLKELGATHVHILPSYDYASVDETKLDENRYNWGYDPRNYNVPDGSYSIGPYKPDVRIREFKQMAQVLHKAGIRVMLDMVYNHTFNTSGNNFECTVPGYFYRQEPGDGFADASACGNETVGDRPMMRKYMIESVLHWINEYHIDGFRFDLVDIHDIETVNEIRKAVTAADPTIFVYGEGWAASAPQLPQGSLAIKVNTYKMPGTAAFSDEIRDALRGPFSDNYQGASLAGLPGGEESIKFSIVGTIKHPQVDNGQVNYSKAPWAEQPTQMISYVSCHDDMCLVGRLKASLPGTTPEELVRLDKLAQTVVFISQSVPLIYADEEVMRDKKGIHNSYQSPDSISAIDWRRKTEHADVFAYYKGLIQLCKNHPALRLGDADLVRRRLESLPVEGSNAVAYHLKENAGGDAWGDIYVILNSCKEIAKAPVLEGGYTVVRKDGFISEQGLGTIYGPEVFVPAQSALIFYK